MKTTFINGRYGVVLDHKVVFYGVFNQFNEYLPILHGVIQKGNVIPVHSPEPVVSVSSIIDLLRNKGALVIKPARGGGGDRVKIVRFVDNTFLLNNKSITEGELEDKLSMLDEFIVTQYIKQHPYASEVFPDTTNTVRLLTMWDYAQNMPFIAFGEHRFGREDSGHLDNWSQGGLMSFFTDYEKGILGKGVSYPRDGQLTYHTIHPETGVQIEGLIVANWNILVTKILEIAAAYPYIPYIGWDIIVTDTAFKIIEGNSHSQVPGVPLFRNPRVREFYRHHGIIQ
ncbi:sugar-transfer associated ATP-grasp domain-containing protein [Acidobacteriota bacterium]